MKTKVFAAALLAAIFCSFVQLVSLTTSATASVTSPTIVTQAEVGTIHQTGQTVDVAGKQFTTANFVLGRNDKLLINAGWSGTKITTQGTNSQTISQNVISGSGLCVFDGDTSTTQVARDSFHELGFRQEHISAVCRATNDMTLNIIYNVTAVSGGNITGTTMNASVITLNR